jgi:alpha-N-arabinofuranosidase
MQLTATAFALCLAVPAAVLCAAEPVAVTIDPGKVLGSIDEKVYGQFLEHIYHSCNGGLWGEMIWDRSFEGNSAATAWRIKNACIVQDGVAPNLRLPFGNAAWTDYEFTLEARKNGGNEGFLILFRAKNNDDYYWANLGGLHNNTFYLERGDKADRRRHTVGKPAQGTIETGRWYKVRVRCEKEHIQVWLDDKPAIDVTDGDGKAHLAGRVGVGTWNTKAEFRNLRVAALDGKVLFDGLPPVSGPPPSMPAWEPYGPGTVELSTDNPLNSDACEMIESPEGETGIRQAPMAFRFGETYRGSLWIRGSAPAGLVLRVTDGAAKLAELAIAAPLGEWRQVPFEFKSTATANNAALQIGVRGKGKVWIDQVSMMPESWRAAGGFRPDLLAAIADLRPPVIRWPGGSFTVAYRWKDAVGPQHKRRAYPRMAWDDKDVNSFGTDEFIAMCRKVAAEPIIVINIGMGEPAKRPEYVAEACDWVEYCNGPAASKWGAVRAANGHPEPYRVRFWEIDNEVWRLKPDEYVDYLRHFVPAMKKVDPSITVIACGSGQLGRAWGDGDKAVIGQCAEIVDYLSVHHYESPAKFADGPADAARFWRSLGQMIAGSKNPRMKLFVSEWNAQTTDWRTGLYAGGALNVFEQCGDAVGMAAPALFMRHVSASGWDNAFINFDHYRWFPAPNYVVMKLWRDHYAPHRIAAAGNDAPLSAIATKSADSRSIFYKAVNPTDQPVAVALTVADSFTIARASLEVVAPGSLDARNTLDNPRAVRPQPGVVTVSGQTIRFTLPPLSAAVITIERR